MDRKGAANSGCDHNRDGDFRPVSVNRRRTLTSPYTSRLRSNRPAAKMKSTRRFIISNDERITASLSYGLVNQAGSNLRCLGARAFGS